MEYSRNSNIRANPMQYNAINKHTWHYGTAGTFMMLPWNFEIQCPATWHIGTEMTSYMWRILSNLEGGWWAQMPAWQQRSQWTPFVLFWNDKRNPNNLDSQATPDWLSRRLRMSIFVEFLNPIPTSNTKAFCCSVVIPRFSLRLFAAAIHIFALPSVTQLTHTICYYTPCRPKIGLFQLVDPSRLSLVRSCRASVQCGRAQPRNLLCCPGGRDGWLLTVQIIVTTNHMVRIQEDCQSLACRRFLWCQSCMFKLDRQTRWHSTHWR